MKLTIFKRTFDSSLGRKTRRAYDVSEAVTEVMDGSCWRDGTLERLGERLDNHARFVGELVQRLTETGGKLGVDDLEHLLSSDFEVGKLELEP